MRERVFKNGREVVRVGARVERRTQFADFGRGFNYATALEGALKVKEVALVHSEGILAGEMKHGPLALVDKHMPIIVVCTNDGSYEKQQSVVQQLKARDGRLILIVSEDDKEMEKTAPDAVICAYRKSKIVCKRLSTSSLCSC